MSKSLTELATEIVSAQIQHQSMTAEEVKDTLYTVFNTLNQLKSVENEGIDANSNPHEKPTIEPKRSILKNKIICLECGAEYRQLSSKHLATHELTAKEYRKKYGLSSRQPLSCKSLTEKRKAMGKERGLPAALKKKQAVAKRRKKK